MSALRRIMLSGIDINAIPDSNKIYYTATEKVIPAEDVLGSRIIFNNFSPSTGSGVIITQEPISAIASSAFENNTLITHIKLPNTLKLVGERAFANTTNLVGLTLTTGDIEFKKNAFLNTGIKTVDVPWFTGYNGPDDLIASNTCANENASPFYSQGAKLTTELGEVTGGTIIRNIGNYAFAGIGNSLNVGVYDSDMDQFTVGKGAFYKAKNIRYINIPSIPTYIKEYAFAYSGLKYTGSDLSGVVEIGDYAFIECNLANNKLLRLKATTIEYNAFSRCILGGVSIEGSVKKVRPASFGNPSFVQFSPTLIKSLYFAKDCKFEDGEFSNVFDYPTYEDTEGISRTKIDYCEIACQFPNSWGVTNNGMARSHIGELHITSDVTKIDKYMFYTCKIDTQFVLPDTINSIEDNAFYYSDIDSIVMGANVSSIGNSAFEGCKFKYIDFSSHTFVPTLPSTNVFKNVLSDCKIIVPDNLYEEWVAATYWKAFAAYIIKKSDWDTQQVTE